MSISDFIFMHKVKSLPPDKNTFLLASMEQVRQGILKIGHVSPNRMTREEIEECKQKRKILLQTGALAVWLSLDDMQKKSITQMTECLTAARELVDSNRAPDMYAAINAGNQVLPQKKKDEYEQILTKYIKLFDSDRQFFLNEVKNPVAQQRIENKVPEEYQRG